MKTAKKESQEGQLFFISPQFIFIPPCLINVLWEAKQKSITNTE